MYESIVNWICTYERCFRNLRLIEDFFHGWQTSRVFRRDFNDCKYEQRFEPLSLIPGRFSFTNQDRSKTRKFAKSLMKQMSMVLVGLASVCYPARKGDKRHFRRSRVRYSSPTVSLSLSLSLTLCHTLSCFLYEVRGVRVARKINNYEARGDDSNGEIKVSQSKVILRILCYSHFVFVFGAASKLFAWSRERRDDRKDWQHAGGETCTY